MTPTSNHITIKYHWFMQNVGKEFVIWKIRSENQKADIFTKGLQGKLGLGGCYAVDNPSYERECSKK